MKILADLLNPGIARYNNYKTGIYQFDKKEYNLAIICFQSEINYFERLHEKFKQEYLKESKAHLAQVYTYIAHSQRRLEKFELARKYYLKALEIHKDYFPALQAISTLEIKQKTAESAKYYEKCVQSYLKNAEFCKTSQNYADLVQLHRAIIKLSDKAINYAKDAKWHEGNEELTAKLCQIVGSCLDTLYKEIIVDALYIKIIEKIDAKQHIKHIYESIAAPIKSMLAYSMQEAGKLLQESGNHEKAKKFYGKAIHCHSQVIKHYKRELGGDYDSQKIKDHLAKAYEDISKANFLLQNYAEASNLLYISSKYNNNMNVENIIKTESSNKVFNLLTSSIVVDNLESEKPNASNKAAVPEESNIDQHNLVHIELESNRNDNDAMIMTEIKSSSDDFDIIDDGHITNSSLEQSVIEILG